MSITPGMIQPEIPDSSKWSSNKIADATGIVIEPLKYQIPVSGVQTCL